MRNKIQNRMSRSEDCEIAIVGLSCRFPGGGDSPEKFWDALEAKKTGIGEIPEDRWDSSRFYHPDMSAAGRYYCRQAGILDDIAGFDAEFFGISPREAEEMDPQQRLLLELSWESLERAGIPPEQIAGSNCAVYVGISATDYGNVRSEDLDSSSRYSLPGASLSIAANRISHFFDLRGTSVAIDTACSSSLVALHEAVCSINSGRSEMALVGGVNMLISPYPFVGLSRAMMLADYGECRAFAKMVKGYVRAEGGGMVVLKPLSQAIADGNPIAGVIRAIGTNNDGRTPGISFPSASQQEALLRNIYDRFDLDPEHLVYLEAHGTGTSVGDPIEAQAIGRAIGVKRRKASLPIGSVKSNIGHLESASGMAGLIKVIGILNRKVIPASLHTQELNPDIPFGDLNIRVVRESEKFVDVGSRALVGVNSFGFGGTNAHVVIEEPPIPEARELMPERQRRAVNLPLSARTESALKIIAGEIASLLEDGVPLRDVARTLALNRTHHGRRLLLTAEDGDAAAKSLRNFCSGRVDPSVVTGSSIMRRPGVVFVFAGHGAQGTDEGLRLMTQDPVLAPQVRRVDEIVRACYGWSIIEQINWPAERREVTPIVLTQLVSFAIQAGLMNALLEKGLRPDAVTGHSFGEIPAAWAAGVLTLEQAVMLIIKRSATQEIARGKGVMAAVSIDAVRAEREIAKYNGLIEIATVNSPMAVTLVGDRVSMNDLGPRLSAQGVNFRVLDLDYAFHSRFLDEGKETLLQELADFKPSEGNYPFYSSVSGLCESGDSLDGDYWWRNLRQSVRFDQAMGSLLANGHAIFIEIGGHPIMQAYMRHSLRALNAPGQPLCVIVRQTADGTAKRVNETMARAYTLGAKIDWLRNQPKTGRLVRLPTYPWERHKYWFPTTPEAKGPLSHPAEGPLLGGRFDSNSTVWESIIDTQLHPILADYEIGGKCIFPLGGYLELVLEAAKALFGNGAVEIQQLQLYHDLTLTEGKTRRLLTCFSETDNRLKIESKPRLSEEKWSLHAMARIIDGSQSRVIPLPSFSEMKAPSRCVSLSEHYDATESLNVSYGPAFRVIDSITVKGGEAEAELTMKDPLEYQLHLAAIESALQLLVDVLNFENDAKPCFTPVARQIKRVLVFTTPVPISRCRASIREQSKNTILADFDLMDADGFVAVSLRGVSFDCRPLAMPVKHPSRYHVTEYVPLEIPGEGALLPSAKNWQEFLPSTEGRDLDFIVGALTGTKPFSSKWRSLINAHPDLLAELLLAGNGRVSDRNERVRMLFKTASTSLAFDRFLEEVLVVVSGMIPSARKIRLLDIVSDEAAECLKIDHDRFAYRKVSSGDALAGDDDLQSKKYDLILLRHPGLVGEDVQEVISRASRMLLASGRLLMTAYEEGPWSELAFGKEALPTIPIWQSLMEGAGLSNAYFFPVSAGFFAVADAPQSVPEISSRSIAESPSIKWMIVTGDSPAEDSLAHDLAIHLVEAGHDIVFLHNENVWRVDELEIGFCFEDQHAWGKVFREAGGTRPTGLIYLKGLSVQDGSTQAIDDATWPLACMAQAIAMSPGIVPPRMIFVTAGAHTLPSAQAVETAQQVPHQAAIWGFGRVLRNEHPDWTCRTIDLHADHAQLPTMSQPLAEEILMNSDEDEVIRGIDRRIGLRIREATDPGESASFGAESLVLKSTGREGKLSWASRPLTNPGHGEIQIEIKAIGLASHFGADTPAERTEALVDNDPNELRMGYEGAGVVTSVGAGVKKFASGDRVFFFAKSCFATHAVISQDHAELMPQGLDFRAAATIPVAFFTATYALAHLARLKTSDRILIQEAAGAVGLAAIQYATHVGAEIFATVGSPEARDLLRLMGVPENHIFSSHSLSFSDDLIEITGGEGVDVVLNSLTGEAIQKGIASLRPFGRFIELGKHDFHTNDAVNFRSLKNNLSYHGIDVDLVLTKNPGLRVEIFTEMAKLFASGVFKPLSYRLFSPNKATEDFRGMLNGYHIGKIIVQPPLLKKNRTYERAPAFEADSEGSYLITGGSNGLGLASADVLVRLGVRRLILVGRSNLGSIAVREAVERFERRGVAVELRACNLADPPSIRSLMRQLAEDGHRVRGIIHAATVYEDGPIVSMSRGQFQRVIAVKAGAALEFQKILKKDGLDFFIYYSSISAALGNPAQGNYAAANAVLDALASANSGCQKLSLSIAWGAISNIGHLSRNTELLSSFTNQFGIRTMSGEAVLSELEMCFVTGGRDFPSHQVMIGDLEWEMPSLRSACGVNRHARFREMAVNPDGMESAKADIRDLIEGLSRDEVFDLTLALLSEQIGEVLKIAPDKLELEQSISDTGMDSLTMMELRILLEKKFGFDLPIMLIREGITIRRLAERIRDFLTQAPEAKIADNLVQLAVKHGVSVDALSGYGGEKSSVDSEESQSLLRT